MAIHNHREKNKAQHDTHIEHKQGVTRIQVSSFLFVHFIIHFFILPLPDTLIFFVVFQ